MILPFSELPVGEYFRWEDEGPGGNVFLKTGPKEAHDFRAADRATFTVSLRDPVIWYDAEVTLSEHSDEEIFEDRVHKEPGRARAAATPDRSGRRGKPL